VDKETLKEQKKKGIGSGEEGQDVQNTLQEGLGKNRKCEICTRQPLGR
jgi:hypothetical protein